MPHAKSVSIQHADRIQEEVRRWLAHSNSNIHMMGVGGIGMAGLAYLLAQQGHHVSGCDAGAPRTLGWLDANGVRVLRGGHDPAHLAQAEWAVFSPALPPGHPERLEALRRNIPLFRRGEVLPTLAEQWKSIAVAGTHGKTTTASMLAHLLRETGTQPSWCIGGELPPDNAPAGKGAQDGYLVLEADESDGTLIHYHPDISIVTNIEFDHKEHFDSLDSFAECFACLVKQTRGTALVCADDPMAAGLRKQHRNIMTYGIRERADIRADNIQLTPEGCSFIFHSEPSALSMPVHLPLPGLHNVSNALAAMQAALLAHENSAPEAFAKALATFALPKRRFETLLHTDTLHVIGDYSHHPTEIKALISAARQTNPRRILAVFQPHRYTRTQTLGREFPAAFEGVAELILTPVYAASEDVIPEGTSNALLKHFNALGSLPVTLVDSLEAAAHAIHSKARPGDMILLIGAGDVETIGRMLAARAQPPHQ